MLDLFETHNHYHNQSHATHYSYLRFHTSYDSLKIRCYNIGIETDFYTPSQSQHKDTDHAIQGRKARVVKDARYL